MVSEGESEVLRAASEEVGDCLLRMRDLVARHFRRTRWGMKTGMAFQPGIRVPENICCAEVEDWSKKAISGEVDGEGFISARAVGGGASPLPVGGLWRLCAAGKGVDDEALCLRPVYMRRRGNRAGMRLGSRLAGPGCGGAEAAVLKLSLLKQKACTKKKSCRRGRREEERRGEELRRREEVEREERGGKECRAPRR